MINNCYIIAEMSANHAMNKSKAIEIIHAAKESGANCIKTQTYTPDTLTINCKNDYFQIKSGTWNKENLYDLYKKAYTPWEWLKDLKEEAEKIGLDFLSTVYDNTSVDFMESLEVNMYKIASFELIDIPLLKYVASKGKPIILSTGMGTIKEIKEAIEAIESQNNKQIYLLKCSSIYPAKYEDMNLNTIKDLEKFGYPVGFSDHSLDGLSSTTAVAMGARIIEKHFCLSRKIKTPDSSFSIEPAEFKKMVDDIRNIEKIKGEIKYSATENSIFRKSIFVVKDIKKGETYTNENIQCIRPGYGIKPKHYESIIGLFANKDIAKGTPLNFDDIKPLPI